MDGLNFVTAQLPSRRPEVLMPTRDSNKAAQYAGTFRRNGLTAVTPNKGGEAAQLLRNDPDRYLGVLIPGFRLGGVEELAATIIELKGQDLNSTYAVAASAQTIDLGQSYIGLFADHQTQTHYATDISNLASRFNAVLAGGLERLGAMYGSEIERYFALSAAQAEFGDIQDLQGRDDDRLCTPLIEIGIVAQDSYHSILRSTGENRISMVRTALAEIDNPSNWALYGRNEFDEPEILVVVQIKDGGRTEVVQPGELDADTLAPYKERLNGHLEKVVEKYNSTPLPKFLQK